MLPEVFTATRSCAAEEAVFPKADTVGNLLGLDVFFCTTRLEGIQATGPDTRKSLTADGLALYPESKEWSLSCMYGL